MPCIVFDVILIDTRRYSVEQKAIVSGNIVPGTGNFHKTLVPTTLTNECPVVYYVLH